MLKINGSMVLGIAGEDIKIGDLMTLNEKDGKIYAYRGKGKPMTFEDVIQIGWDKIYGRKNKN